MKSTTQNGSIESSDKDCSPVPVKSSSSEPSGVTQCLFGETLLTTRDRKASTVPCSETKADTKAVSLSDRLTPLLISSGLVKGIIPTSLRVRSNPVIPAIASWLRDGYGLQSEQKEDSLFLKECCRCHKQLLLTLENWGVDVRRPDGFRSDCRACYRIYQREFRRKYRGRAGVRERELEYAKTPAVKQSHKRYIQSEKGKAMQSRKMARRFARKLELPDAFTQLDWEMACQFFDNSCAYCESVESLEPDHIIPLRDAGCPGTVSSNIVPACKSCNRSKQHKSLRDWAFVKFGTSAQGVIQRVTEYSSMRKQSGLQILDFALSPQDGESADEQRAG